ncbi:helix-turn-helix domain-containing protein [Nocardioides caeni]|uniref:Helix-turn-helix transcriptional regulator n=1 Tax=Nocardioides caeni TaxID=574700 RepID=A0A4S8NMN4_9ACTN|nr:helix-turn-helix transcriptional regulator [Nocardioides caeni]THV18210.1 helix-turn-helix transcriptional regulator [Nocardioides caeni]
MAATPDPAPSTEPLWRELVGDELRRRRRERGATLTEIAERAGISPQYLSEIERGRKEPSSEMIAAVAGALGITLLDLTTRVARDLVTLRPVGDLRREGRQAYAMAA